MVHSKKSHVKCCGFSWVKIFIVAKGFPKSCWCNRWIGIKGLSHLAIHNPSNISVSMNFDVMPIFIPSIFSCIKELYYAPFSLPRVNFVMYHLYTYIHIYKWQMVEANWWGQARSRVSWTITNHQCQGWGRLQEGVQQSSWITFYFKIVTF